MASELPSSPNNDRSMAISAAPNSKTAVTAVVTSANDTVNEKNPAKPAQEAAAKGDWWKWEIFGIVGSAAALVAIIAFLASIDEKPQPSWAQPYQSTCVDVFNHSVCHTGTISINSIVSWISTVSEALLLLTLTNCLGQLKWVWYAQKKRKLSDLQMFDEASRGFVGSGMLIWNLGPRHWAALGAFIFMLTLGFDPFIQNLVHYYSKSVPDNQEQALVSNVSVYSYYGSLVGGDTYSVEPVMKANAYAAIFNADPYYSWAYPYNICDSGECYWEPVASVGLCSQCTNTTSTLTTNCTTVYTNSTDSSDSSSDDSDDSSYQNCTVSLPSGLSLWYLSTQGAASLMVMDTSYTPEVYSNSSERLVVVQSILALGTIYPDDSTPFISSECNLLPCLQSYSGNYGYGDYYDYNETLIGNWTERITDDSDDVLFYRLGAPNQTDIGVNPDEKYGITMTSFNAIQTYLDNLFNGKAKLSSDNVIFTTSREATSSSTDATEAIYYGDYYDCGNPNDKVGCAIENVAQAVSKSMRDAPYLYTTNTSTANMTLGITYSDVTYIHVTWYWMVLPLLIWVLAIVLLIGTIWKTRRSGVQRWRNSPLPLVFLALAGEDDDRDDEKKQDRAEAEFDKAINDLSKSAMASKADKVKVSLRVVEKGAKYWNS